MGFDPRFGPQWGQGGNFQYVDPAAYQLWQQQQQAAYLAEVQRRQAWWAAMQQAQAAQQAAYPSADYYAPQAATRPAHPHGMAHPGDVADINRKKPAKKTDASNDGRFSWKEALKNLGKGLISPITGMFGSVAGFAIGCAGIVLGGLALLGTGGMLAPLLVAGGLAWGTFVAARAGYKMLAAQNGDDMEKAFYDVGEAAVTLVPTAWGARASLHAAAKATSFGEAAINQMGMFRATWENVRAIPGTVSMMWKARGQFFGNIGSGFRRFFGKGAAASQPGPEPPRQLPPPEQQPKSPAGSSDTPGSSGPSGEPLRPFEQTPERVLTEQPIESFEKPAPPPASKAGTPSVEFPATGEPVTYYHRKTGDAVIVTPHEHIGPDGVVTRKYFAKEGGEVDITGYTTEKPVISTHPTNSDGETAGTPAAGEATPAAPVSAATAPVANWGSRIGKTTVINRKTGQPVQAEVWYRLGQYDQRETYTLVINGKEAGHTRLTKYIEKENALFAHNRKKKYQNIEDIPVGGIYNSTTDNLFTEHIYVGMMRSDLKQDYKNIGTRLHQIALERSFQLGAEGRVALCADWSSHGFHYKAGFRPVDKTKEEQLLALLAEANGTEPNTSSLAQIHMYLPEDQIALWKQRIAEAPILKSEATEFGTSTASTLQSNAAFAGNALKFKPGTSAEDAFSIQLLERAYKLTLNDDLMQPLGLPGEEQLNTLPHKFAAAIHNSIRQGHSPYITGKVPSALAGTDPTELGLALDKIATQLRANPLQAGTSDSFAIGNRAAVITRKGGRNISDYYELQFSGQEPIALKVFKETKLVGTHGAYGEVAMTREALKAGVVDIPELYLANPTGTGGWMLSERITPGKPVPEGLRLFDFLKRHGLEHLDQNEGTQVGGYFVDLGGIRASKFDGPLNSIFTFNLEVNLDVAPNPFTLLVDGLEGPPILGNQRYVPAKTFEELCELDFIKKHLVSPEPGQAPTQSAELLAPTAEALKPMQVRAYLAKEYRKVGTPGYLTIADKIESGKLPLDAVWKQLIEHTYKQIRRFDYPIDSRHNHLIDQITGGETQLIEVLNKDGWHYRIPKNRREFGWSMNNPSTDRLSLNVVADEKLIAALDDFFSQGKAKGYYKTPDQSSNWLERHDPITIYLHEPTRPDIEQALAELVQPFIRGTDDVLVGRKIAPGFAAETSPTQAQLEGVIQSAKQIDPDFGSAVQQYFTDQATQKLKASSGNITAVNRLIGLFTDS